MRLGLYSDGTAPGADMVRYWIFPALADGVLYKPEDTEYAYLITLMPRIERMAQEVLGDLFSRIEKNDRKRVLELHMSANVLHSRNRTHFRQFVGWVSLHDLEPIQHDSEMTDRIRHIARESVGHRVGTVEDWPTGHSGRSK